MSNSIIQIFKRFPGLKSIPGIQIETKINKNLVLRHKIPVVVMEKERITKDDGVSSEIDFISWLHQAAPGFPIDGCKIDIIHEPGHFYATLIEKCKYATKRITFASLYLGSGELESKLVKVIEESVDASQGNIRVKILLDYMRGSRGQQSSRKMLEPLVSGKWRQCYRVFLYHTPKLRGILKLLIPDRFNELIGLQHMKIYLIDNSLIISGANLSNDYFTNRQDRYLVIEDCEELCDFYDSLVERVGEFSFILQSDNSTKLNSTMKSHPFKGSRKDFTREAADKIQSLFQNEMNKHMDKEPSESDTWIFPLIEMGQLGIHHDSKITLKLLQTLPPNGTLRWATGYFNLTSEYSNALLKYCQTMCHLLTAHPTANGFFGAKGIAGGIPAAYTKIEEAFYRKCEKMGQENRITLWEFIRPGWTYHAKGLWYSLPGEKRPCLTLIGSPNFGYRSVRRDLETQVAIVTKNEQLQTKLQKEYENLFSRAQPVTRKTLLSNDRLAPLWVCAAVFLFRYYF